MSLSEDPGAGGAEGDPSSAASEEYSATAPTDPPDLVAAVIAEDWGEVGRIVDADWLPLMIDHLPTLFWMYRSLPSEVIDSHLILRAGRDLLLLGPTGLIPHGPVPVDTGAVGRSPAALQILIAATGSLTILRLAGSHRASCALVGQATAIAAEAGKTPSDELVSVLPSLQLMWGIALQLGGDLPGSLREFKRSYDGNFRLGLGSMARDAAGKAALTVALKGDLIEASAWLAREAKFPEPEGWLSGVAPVAGNVARATVALGRLDRDAAVAAISKLRRLAPREDYWAFVAVATAQLGLLFGRPTESLHQLRDLQASNEGPVGDGIGPPVLLAAELDLLIAMGRGDRALRMLAETEVDSPQLTVITARLNLLAGIPTDADSVAREALSATHTPRIRLELLLIRAVALNRIGDRAASLRCLAEGLEISDRYELLSPFAGVPRELLKAAVADVPGVAAITAVLDASSVRRVFPERLQLTELTPRELVVLQELAARGSLALISEKLFVSLATLKSQRNSLYRKLGVHTRKEALEQAYERGLL